MKLAPGYGELVKIVTLLEQDLGSELEGEEEEEEEEEKKHNNLIRILRQYQTNRVRTLVSCWYQEKVCCVRNLAHYFCTPYKDRSWFSFSSCFTGDPRDGMKGEYWW